MSRLWRREDLVFFSFPPSRQWRTGCCQNDVIPCTESLDWGTSEEIVGQMIGGDCVPRYMAVHSILPVSVRQRVAAPCRPETGRWWDVTRSVGWDLCNCHVLPHCRTHRSPSFPLGPPTASRTLTLTLQYKVRWYILQSPGVRAPRPPVGRVPTRNATPELSFTAGQEHETDGWPRLTSPTSRNRLNCSTRRIAMTTTAGTIVDHDIVLLNLLRPPCPFPPTESKS